MHFLANKKAMLQVTTFGSLILLNFNFLLVFFKYNFQTHDNNLNFYMPTISCLINVCKTFLSPLEVVL